MSRFARAITRAYGDSCRKQRKFEYDQKKLIALLRKSLSCKPN